jgi:hypothetical protein
MAKKQLKKDYLRLLANGAAPSLGNTVAEQDRRLIDYYVGRHVYVDRAIDEDDPASFFVGPKGVGKSAILQMVRLLKATDAHRIIDISPDDLAFSALANIQASTPIIAQANEHQWLFKSLWDYVLSLEILRREYSGQLGWIDKVLRVFQGQAQKEAKQLLNMSISDDGSPHTLTDRMLQLVNEIELSIQHQESKAAAKAVLQHGVRGADQKLKLLSLVNSVAKQLSTILEHDYYILIDDLDLHWQGTEIQNAFIAALFQTIKKMSRPNIRFVVAIREQIYRELPLEDRDKFRSAVCEISWDMATVKSMIEQRLTRRLNCRQTEIWGCVFETDVFATLWTHTNGTPRELIRLTELCLDIGLRAKHRSVISSDVDDAIRKFSEQRIDDLESEWAYRYRGLGHLIRRFNGWPKEFPLKTLDDICLGIACDIDKNDANATKYSRARGYLEDRVGLAKILLETGVLRYKLSRTDPPRIYDPRVSTEFHDGNYLAVHPMYAPALGLVGA